MASKPMESKINFAQKGLLYTPTYFSNKKWKHVIVNNRQQNV